MDFRKLIRFFVSENLDQGSLDLMQHCDTLPHTIQGWTERQRIVETLATRGYLLVEQEDGSMVWQSKKTGQQVRYYLGWIRHAIPSLKVDDMSQE